MYYTNPIILTSTSNSQTNYDNGPLIGGIIGGILGLLLLLALILLLVWCLCCRRRRQARQEKNQTDIRFYNQQNLSSQSGVSAYAEHGNVNNVNNIEITQDGWRSLGNPSAAFIHLPQNNQSGRYTNHIEIANLNTAASMSNISNHKNGIAIATIRSEAPELFLKTITLPKDANEEAAYNFYSQKDVTYNSNSGYLTDEEFHAQRKEYFVNTHHGSKHSLSHQQQQQQNESRQTNEINFHYV